MISEERYNYVKDKMSAFLKKCNYKPENIAFIPISGLNGDNLYTNSELNTPWYKGPSLFQALQNLHEPKVNAKAASKPARMCVFGS